MTAHARSTKAGTEAPATPGWASTGAHCSPALNKGRDRSPGNTHEGRRSTPRNAAAQQRPGPKPRQHTSTAASTSTVEAAQQRPGPKPRQHTAGAGGREGEEGRSTKAGTEAPATLGPEVPDTRTMLATLNKGRDRSPGNTRQEQEAAREKKDAQQRPGPKPRQHYFEISWTPPLQLALNKGRDRSPGNTQGRLVRTVGLRIAQQRPGPKPRQHDAPRIGAVQAPVRSTKAGTEAPATPGAPSRTRTRLPRALNKGRDRSPGNTCTSAGAGLTVPRAQQRPGPKPRQHWDSDARVRERPPPLNKGRDRSPGNTTPGPPPPLAAPPLNKGRDRSPGNTPRA